jgi:predicted anti-sigma-YlaC factor YlaD
MDALVAVSEALDWDALPAVDHLATCAACRARLRELADVRDALVYAEAPAPGFAERVVASLVDAPPRAPRLSPVLAGCNALLAAATVALTLSPLAPAAGSGPPGGASAGATLAVSVLAGAGALYLLVRGRRAEPAA